MSKNVMVKKENEAVVNRFLLSTVYIIIFEMFLFFMYKLSCGNFGFPILMHLQKIHLCIAVIGILLSIYFAVRHFGMKKGNLYHFAIFLILGLTGLYLNYTPHISAMIYESGVLGNGNEFMNTIYSIFHYTSKRYIMLALIYLAFYVYEVIVYFLRANK